MEINGVEDDGRISWQNASLPVGYKAQSRTITEAHSTKQAENNERRKLSHLTPLREEILP